MKPPLWTFLQSWLLTIAVLVLRCLLPVMLPVLAALRLYVRIP